MKKNLRCSISRCILIFAQHSPQRLHCSSNRMHALRPLCPLHGFSSTISSFLFRDTKRFQVGYDALPCIAVIISTPVAGGLGGGFTKTFWQDVSSFIHR